jgi:hypothetical protein
MATANLTEMDTPIPTKGGTPRLTHPFIAAVSAAGATPWPVPAGWLMHLNGGDEGGWSERAARGLARGPGRLWARGCSTLGGIIAPNVEHIRPPTPFIAAVTAAGATPQPRPPAARPPAPYPVATGATLIRTGRDPHRNVSRARVMWGSTAEA